MILERICLEDFGIFRNQIMEGIHPGLVVLFGGNRSGKTTFMKALRHLGYGFPKTPAIPPPSGNQHMVITDVRLHNGEKYAIQLAGYGAPRVSPLEGSKAATIQEIYNGLDSYTYKQVFTISLDELRRIPEDTPAKEEQRLHAVLLGGGWSDALRLTHITQEFAKKAEDIGGKRGAKNVGSFRAYSQSIKDGLALKDEANREMDEFYQMSGQLAADKEELSRMEDRLAQKQRELARYELIRDYFPANQKFISLSCELEIPENKDLLDHFPQDGLSRSRKLLEQLPQVRQNFEAVSGQFEAAAGTEDPEPLLEKGDLLDFYEKQLSGWRQKSLLLKESLEEHNEDAAHMAAEMTALNSHWGKELSRLEGIPLDIINEEVLLNLADDHRETQRSLKDCTRKIRQTEEALEKKEQARKLTGQKNTGRKNILVLTAAGIIIVLLTAALLGPWASLAAGVVSGAGIIVYFLYNVLGPNARSGELAAAQIRDLQEQLAVFENEKSQLEKEAKEISEKLKNMLQSVNLPDNLPPEGIPDLIRGIRDLKKRYAQWVEKDTELKEQAAGQNRLLTELEDFLSTIWAEHSVWKGSHEGREMSPESRASLLFDEVETACSHLKVARELKNIGIQKEKLEQEAYLLLREGKSSAAQEELSSYDDYIQVLESFSERGQKYQMLQKKHLDFTALKKGINQALATPKNRKILNAPDHSKDEDLTKIFGSLCAGFDSHEEAKQAYDVAEQETRKLMGEIEERKKKTSEQEIKISQLASDEKLQKAGMIIAEARHSLEQQAEQYAINRLAALMTEKTYKELIKETKGKVLGKAGGLLEKMTSGAYGSIDFSEGKDDRDFIAVPTGATRGLSTAALSRGTREQLFLSVRFSRIMEIAPPLPVILDDSMANFDPVHAREAIGITARLAETHQVFVLTCHPELLEWIGETGCPVQYWGLDKGSFTGPFREVPASLI